MSFFRINNQTASFGYPGPEAFSNNASCSKFGTDVSNGKLNWRNGLLEWSEDLGKLGILFFRKIFN